MKWAIESATKIQCVYRDRVLLAEASPATARKLEEIALHIASSFRALLDRFSSVEGVSADDRGVFVLGLYDGMMNETRNAGQPLPSRPGSAKRQRGRKRTAPRGASLHVHPYSLAVGLGKQVRWRRSLRSWKWLCANAWPRSTQTRPRRPQRHERRTLPHVNRVYQAQGAGAARKTTR